jgi:hypothetical protein
VGQDVTVEVKFNPAQDVSAAKIDVNVKALGINVWKEHFDFCADVGIECPAKAGSALTGRLVYKVPAFTPPGITADIEVLLTDADGSVLSCAVVQEKVVKDVHLRSSAVPTRREVEFLFESWRRQHGMVFSPAELVARLDAFEANHHKILAHNADPEATWTMGHNQFSHLSQAEFEDQFLSAPPPMPGFGEPALPWEEFQADHPMPALTSAGAIDPLDWTTRGAVTGVKDQHLNGIACGSCWSFSTTGAIEGVHAVKHGGLVSMSEQQLIDCNSANHGCAGGYMTLAFDYVKHNGISTEEAYPYTAVQGGCAGGTSALGPGWVTGYYAVPPLLESELVRAVSSHPTSVGVCAGDIQLYAGGVFSGKCCNQINHGMLAVGYGNGFWKVKNSWGSGWGEGGYIRFVFGRNQCGIANMVSFPRMV